MVVMFTLIKFSTMQSPLVKSWLLLFLLEYCSILTNIFNIKKFYEFYTVLLSILLTFMSEQEEAMKTIYLFQHLSENYFLYKDK